MECQAAFADPDSSALQDQLTIETQGPNQKQAKARTDALFGVWSIPHATAKEFLHDGAFAHPSKG